MGNADFDVLVSFLLGFARQILPKQGTFAPFAAVLTKERKTRPIAPYDGENASTQTQIDILVEGMRGEVKKGKLIACGLCTNVEVMPPNAALKTNAIQVHLESQQGEALDVYLPYEKATFEFRDSELFLAKSANQIFSTNKNLFSWFKR